MNMLAPISQMEFDSFWSGVKKQNLYVLSTSQWKFSSLNTRAIKSPVPIV